MFIRRLKGEQLSLLSAMKPFFPRQGHNLVDLCLGLFDFVSRQENSQINPEAAVSFINVLNAQAEQRRLARLQIQMTEGETESKEAENNPFLLFLILLLLIVSFDD
jgi:hypothetical protein